MHVRGFIFIKVLNGEETIWMMCGRPNVDITLDASSCEVLVLQLLQRSYLNNRCLMSILHYV